MTDIMTNSARRVSESDVVIIGAGPVGIFAVFACGMLGIRCQVVDWHNQLGGQCSTLYPEKPIYDIPGYPRIKASDLIDQLTAQARPFAPVYHLGHEVQTLEQTAEDKWSLTTNKGFHLRAKAVIIAGGDGHFVPNRPPLPNLSDYEGHSAFYLVSHIEDFANRRVVIAGGGDSAIDWTIILAEIADQVFLIHRRRQFRAMAALLTRLEEHVDSGQVEIITPYQVSALEGDGGQLKRVGISSIDRSNYRWLKADRLLLFFGIKSQIGAIANWGLELDGQRIVIDPHTAATNLPGVFAVGDMATYPNKHRLILTGFAEATQAAHAIYPLVFPGRALHFEHSTTKGIPTLA